MNKPIYRLVDCKGRVLIPKFLRESLELDCGDFVKLIPANSGISVEKVHLIEVGDKSPEAVEAFVKAAIGRMPPNKRLKMAVALLGKENVHEE